MKAAAAFLFSLVIYSLTLAPTVTFVDSGELAAAVATHGVSHPSGSPLYLLLASLPAAIPIGRLILRLNFFSALCAAASVSLVFLILQEISVEPPPKAAAKKDKKKPQPQPVVESPYPQLCGSIAVALAWTLDLGLWSTATVTEVYGLYALCFTLLAWL